MGHGDGSGLTEASERERKDDPDVGLIAGGSWCFTEAHNLGGLGSTPRPATFGSERELAATAKRCGTASVPAEFHNRVGCEIGDHRSALALLRVISLNVTAANKVMCFAVNLVEVHVREGALASSSL